MNKEILYNGHPLTLVLFHGSPRLWIHYPEQESIPKMEFVGGYPNEWCIYVRNLTDEEKSQIKDEDGNTVDISKEFNERDIEKVKESIKKYSNIYIVLEGVFNKNIYPLELQKAFEEELKKRNITEQEIEEIKNRKK